MEYKLPLNGHHAKGKWVTVSECDYEFLKGKKINVNATNGRPIIYIKEDNKLYYLHRYIVGLKEKTLEVVDHKDGTVAGKI